MPFCHVEIPLGNQKLFLETGKLADLVVLSADPLNDIHNTSSVRYIMKNGELFDGDSLDQIWPEKKPLPRLWWWDEKPAK